MARLYASVKDGNQVKFIPLAATIDADGLGVLKVDTELSVDSLSLNIDNLKIASTDGTVGNAKYLKVDADGTIYANVTFPDILDVDENPLKKANITAEYTYVVAGNGVGKVETIKEYATGAGAGDPAKLSVYSYNAQDKVSLIVVSDTTV